MCLQWCHVTSQIIHNDHPCQHCPVSIRLAKANERCETCTHRREGEHCALTRQSLPQARTCCHHNASPYPGGNVSITRQHIPAALFALLEADTVNDIFWAVESAPEPEIVHGDPNHVRIDLRDLAEPGVYGLPANEWEAAL